jgi:acyl carrier protein
MMPSADRTEPIEEQVLSVTAKQVGVKRQKLTLESRLNYELGVHGDDAVELFQAFGEHFGVDLDPLLTAWCSASAGSGRSVLPLR